MPLARRSFDWLFRAVVTLGLAAAPGCGEPAPDNPSSGGGGSSSGTSSASGGSSSGGNGGGGSLNCTPPASEPAATPFNRAEPNFDADDPITTRLCAEGATPPADLENPWDLHCEIEAGHGAAVTEAADPPAALRIVEWNIKFGTALPEVIATLKTHPVLSKADVLLLVEVDRGCNRSGKVDVARTIAAELGMDWVFGVEFVEHAQGGCEEGNAILSRFPLGNPAHQFHDVGKVKRGALSAPFDWSLSADEPRTGRRSFVSADVRFGGGLLRLTSAHLENKSSEDERAGEAGEILDAIAALPRRRGCIAGDFNVFPDIGTTVVDAPLFDRFAGACFVNPHGDLPQAERRTRPALNYQIDFTYTRALAVKDRGVINDFPDVPSDHYPVWVDIAEP